VKYLNTTVEIAALTQFIWHLSYFWRQNWGRCKNDEDW